jgi:hypothetical protein
MFWNGRKMSNLCVVVWSVVDVKSQNVSDVLLYPIERKLKNLAARNRTSSRTLVGN